VSNYTLRRRDAPRIHSHSTAGLSNPGRAGFSVISSSSRISPAVDASQADSQKSICLGGVRRGVYLRRNDRPNSFANFESSSVLIIKQVSKDNDGFDSGLIATPSVLRPNEAGLVTIATPTC
jgi:hypothetical protein